MNRLTKLFKRKKQNILNVYFTAGHPSLNSIPIVIKTLEKEGVDLIELGMPYSDPLADGETIQKSSQKALKNGMTLQLLFDTVREVRKVNSIPIIAMGYYNQLIQYGVTNFLEKCKESGIDGLIIPDLPMHEFESEYKAHFEKNDIKIAFLITPQTSDERIRKADALSSAFLYVVAQSSITGKTTDIEQDQIDYFNRINDMNLESPKLIGFGIHDKSTYDRACSHATGAIIGSAFIRALEANPHNLSDTVKSFIKSIR